MSCISLSPFIHKSTYMCVCVHALSVGAYIISLSFKKIVAIGFPSCSFAIVFTYQLQLQSSRDRHREHNGLRGDAVRCAGVSAGSGGVSDCK